MYQPHTYRVGLSDALWQLRHELIDEAVRRRTTGASG
ncbi:MAG: hypothetical protein U1D30_24680 [Planctomycetota bacterium]